MVTAINQLNYNPASQEVQTGMEDSDRQFILQGTYLRDILLRAFRPPTEDSTEQEQSESTEDASINATSELALSDIRGMFKDDMFIQSWATRYSSPDPVVVEGDPILKDLNASQIRAIALMISQRFSLIQGPPGTGKTKTIIETVRLLKEHFQTSFPILLCTYTNVAVDNLVEGLMKTGLKPLRIGYGGKVKEMLQETTLEAKVAAHPLKKVLERVNNQAEALEKRQRNLLMRISDLKAKAKKSGSLSERLGNMETHAVSMERQLRALNGKAYGTYQEMLKEIVIGADVVCSRSSSLFESFMLIGFFPSGLHNLRHFGLDGPERV